MTKRRKDCKTKPTLITKTTEITYTTKISKNPKIIKTSKSQKPPQLPKSLKPMIIMLIMITARGDVSSLG